MSPFKFHCDHMHLEVLDRGKHKGSAKVRNVQVVHVVASE